MSLFCKCSDKMEAYKKAIELEMQNFNTSMGDIQKKLREAVRDCTNYSYGKLNGNITIILNKALVSIEERIKSLENRKLPTKEVQVLPTEFATQMKHMASRIEELERKNFKFDNELEHHIGILLHHINRIPHEHKPKPTIDPTFQAKLKEALKNNVTPKDKRKRGRPRKVTHEQKTK